MIDVVIVEDGMLVRLRMEMCVDDYCSSMKVLEAFSNAKGALKYLEENYADKYLLKHELVENNFPKK